MKMRRGPAALASAGLFIFVAAAVTVGILLTSVLQGGTENASSSTTGSATMGVVTGYVTVGPSQPVCSSNQPCNVNITGYSLVFVPQCLGAGCKTLRAEILSAGHYSVLLPAGTYVVTGLYPSCDWLGCSHVFPASVVVEGGMQQVLNFDIDTGIR